MNDQEQNLKARYSETSNAREIGIWSSQMGVAL